ncbi:recombination protein NinB [Burkholderia cenocepacia]|uniref:recombination protein NinB n=1 Tax=Burkholderia cenocepacia TaxID=95486 RepID=UPI001B8DE970|nr:recombination protein NinB [Burkholderia cenocepacia]MBR8429044.1 recombination protein NinB [Burkholderia cenocepacia]
MMPTYILRNKDIAQRMVDYIKAVAGPAAASGKPIVVEVGEYQAKRSTQANARYWALLEEISGQAYVDGKRFSREAWHTYFREQYAPKEDGPAGLTPMSTSQMDKETFQRYVTQIEVYAAETLGVEFAYV